MDCQEIVNGERLETQLFTAGLIAVEKICYF